jgi:hypothetical protein
VQFPFSAPIYFCCVVPLGILSYVGLANLVSPGRRLLLLLPVAGFYLAFVMLLILPNRIYSRGLSFTPAPQAIVTVPQVGGVGALDPLVGKR